MSIDNSLGFILNHAGRKLTQMLTLRYQPYDMTTEQWSVLNRLDEQDGITQKELAIRSEKDQTNVTRILDQLERKGLAERRPNVSDRRSFLTYITDKGRSLIGVLTPIEKEVVEAVLDGLSEAQRTLLRDMLVHVTNHANNYIKESGNHLD